LTAKKTKTAKSLRKSSGGEASGGVFEKTISEVNGYPKEKQRRSKAAVPNKESTPLDNLEHPQTAPRTSQSFRGGGWKKKHAQIP